MYRGLVIPLGLGLVAGPAAALTPPWLVCDNADGTTSEFMATYEADDETLPGMTTFLVYSADKQGDATEVIVHCATRQAVSWVEPEDITESDKINDLIDDSGRITLRQLARRINRLGVKAAFGKLSKDNCACDPTTYYSSF